VKNFTLADKQALQTLLQAGNQVAEVAYDPGTVQGGNPETAAIAAGWTQYYKETNPGLTEVIYTKPNVPVVVPPGDPDFSMVSLLLRCDGIDGSSTFIDSSTNAFTVTATATTIEATQGLSGSGAGAFGESPAGLTVPITAAGPLDLTTGDFTIECYVQSATFPGFTSTSDNNTLQLFSAGGTGVNDQQAAVYNNTNVGSPGALRFELEDTLGRHNPQFLNSYYTTDSQLLAGQWNHVALVRAGSNMTMYVNGIGSAPFTVTGALGGGLGNFIFGASTVYPSSGSSTASFPSMIFDEVRVTKGLARYTSNFTPTYAPFPGA
jgi:hypothetical protein